MWINDDDDDDDDDVILTEHRCMQLPAGTHGIDVVGANRKHVQHTMTTTTYDNIVPDSPEHVSQHSN